MRSMWSDDGDSMTDEELTAQIALLEQEMRQEWCVTLIWQELDKLRREQDRRRLLAGLNGPPALLGLRILPHG